MNRIDPDAVSVVVGRVLFNASNYPEQVQRHMLGQDTSMLRALIVDAIMDELRPSESVTLTPEEVRLAREWYTRLPIGVTVDDVALAKKLEASE